MTASVRPLDAPLAVRGRGLTKEFQDRTVLDAVDLDVAAGQFVVLLGPSGSGKTTLLRCVAGTERPTSGTLWVGGAEVSGPAGHVPPERRGLAMVFQDYALWPHMSARGNVAFAVRRLGLGRAEARVRTMEMLERVGLAPLADHYPGQMSGGEQQRVALARALGCGARLLLCDEPLSNLDAHLRERIRVEISTLCRDSGTSVVYITHDQQEAFALADKLGVMHQGRVLQWGTPESVHLRPNDAFVARFTGLAGQIRGQVVRVESPTRVEVRCGRYRLQATAPHPLAETATVDVLLRPDAISMVAPSPSPQVLAALVKDVSFRAGWYEHVVDLPSGERLTGIRAGERHERGRNVGLQLDPAGCLAFAPPPADDSSQLDALAGGNSSWLIGENPIYLDISRSEVQLR
ncbi:MAG TPA: ABC transporter ATP-binding protein [Candidatus Dormibacteraeota bacterium]|nr:ABC transporter ATP-binding protein [Candidatus Dormibacteraeota bacterium]